MNPFSLIPAPYQIAAKLISGLILMLALWYAWHQFTGHYIDIGKAETVKKLQPQIDNLKINNKTLTDAYADLGTKATACSDSVKSLEIASATKKATVTRALAEAEKRASGAQRQADWLSDQLAKPGNQQKTCSDALREWRAEP